MRPLLLLVFAALFTAVLLAGCPPPGTGPQMPSGGGGTPTDGGRDAP